MFTISVKNRQLKVLTESLLVVGDLLHVNHLWTDAQRLVPGSFNKLSITQYTFLRLLWAFVGVTLPSFCCWRFTDEETFSSLDQIITQEAGDVEATTIHTLVVDLPAAACTLTCNIQGGLLIWLSWHSTTVITMPHRLKSTIRVHKPSGHAHL